MNRLRKTHRGYRSSRLIHNYRNPRSAGRALPVHSYERGSHEASKPGLNLLIGLIIVLLLTTAKIHFEGGQFGKHLEEVTADLLQLRLTDTAGGRLLPVTVVDLTGMEVQEGITPRNNLTGIVSAIAGAQPSAIGIDIIFQPDGNGNLSKEDTDFLNFCLSAKIPIFVGIHESIVRGPESWLGKERFKKLGAAVVVPKNGEEDKQTARLMKSITLNGKYRQVKAESLSYKLSEVYRSKLEHCETKRASLVRWLRKYKLLENEGVNPREGLEAQEFLIDFGIVARLRASHLRAECQPGLPLPTCKIEPVSQSSKVPRSTTELSQSCEAMAKSENDAMACMKGKVVLVSAAGVPSDPFAIPGQGPVPGVYVQAAGVDTLVNPGLYALTNGGRIGLDILAAIFPLGILFLVELRYRTTSLARGLPERLSRLLSVGMAVAVVIIGYYGIESTRLYWTDFLMVAGALLLHGTVDDLVDLVRENWGRSGVRA
jgi:CHASE2 domain-containing sensor protein